MRAIAPAKIPAQIATQPGISSHHASKITFPLPMCITLRDTSGPTEVKRFNPSATSKIKPNQIPTREICNHTVGISENIDTIFRKNLDGELFSTLVESAIDLFGVG